MNSNVRFWSNVKLICAIGLCLLPWINAQLIYSASSTQESHTQYPSQQYQPLINIAYPSSDNQSENIPTVPIVENSQQISNAWTPVVSSRNVAPINSVYTAINPPSPPSSPNVPQASYMLPSPRKPFGSSNVPLESVSPFEVNQNASQYHVSESISRSSYQKPQSTYMIHPAKYQQAFPTSNRNSSKQSGKSSRRSSKSSKLINSEVMPIPMIKPHRHGATLGFNLPDQGLTLYLDINELVTKPMAQNIGLKVVSHGNRDDFGEESNESGLSEVNHKVNTTILASNTTKKRSKLLKKIKSHNHKEKNMKLQSTTNDSKTNNASSGTKGQPSRFNIKSKTNSGRSSSMMSPAQKAKAVESLNPELNSISNRLESEKSKFSMLANRTDIPPSASRIPATYAKGSFEDDVQQKTEQESEEKIDNEVVQKKTSDTDSADEKQPEPVEDSNDDDISNEDEEISSVEDNASNGSVESLPDVDSLKEDSVSEDDEDGDDDDDEDDEDSDNKTENAKLIATTKRPSSSEKSLETTTMMPVKTNTVWDVEKLTPTTTTIPLVEDKNPYKEEPKISNITLVKKQELFDNKLVERMQGLLEKSAKLIDMSTNTCSVKPTSCKRSQDTCETSFDSITSNTSTTVREIAQQLDANIILDEVTSVFESEMQDFMDFSSDGYTIILPSNNAVRRLPPNLLKQWKQNSDSFHLEGYLLEGVHTIKSLADRKLIETRNKMILHINNPSNLTYTINGQRVLHANQKAPSGGIVHVIDGLLYPSSDKDIIETLKSCGRLDGFVTLAEGTGFADTLRKGNSFTVFVPSNDALQKVPDSDLEMIRRNMTALREFLMYHVVQGVFYSQDLRDGQFMPSVLDGEYLQAGVRVDGCSRRLVEVNVSPLYRADIPASNGVIHVVDWILKPDDRDWCNGVILPRRR